MQRYQVLFFSILFFISATLLFSVQPMIGKMMLPYVGGSPAGWVVAMAFFQAALLAGYGLAHLCSKLNVFTQGIVTILFLLAGLVSTPVTFDGNWIMEFENITAGIVFIKLSMVVALPFIALSSITPAMQRVFSAGSHHSAQDPYYLYAASNLGSFFGLLSYPVLVEPFFPLQTQSIIWLWLYCLLIGLCVVASAIIFLEKRHLIKIGLGNEHLKEHDAAAAEPLSWKTCLYWLALAAIPSSLILGVTTYITADIASVPMIWIIPLGLYLLSHVIAFARRRPIHDTEALRIIQAVLIGISIFSYVNPIPLSINVAGFITSVLIFLLAFFVTALLLHIKLADNRPPPQHLTFFYFMISLGGALGGSFNAFIAPLIFNDNYEFPIILLLSLLLTGILQRQIKENYYVQAGLVLITTSAFFLGNYVIIITPLVDKIAIPLLMLFLFSAFLSLFYIRSMAVTLTMVIALQILFFIPAKYSIAHRNFFGISKIYTETDYQINKDETASVKFYKHGNTIHGLQINDEEQETEVFSYYPPVSPVGNIFAVSKPRKVGVLGLGAGVMACYRKDFPNIKVSFFEIDPYVSYVAREHFTFLDKCGYEDILIGDGRLIIENLPPEEKFDLFMMDAFTSDAVPTHLLTREAIKSYMDHLSQDGILIFNTSNRYLNLKKPLEAAARSLDKKAYNFRYYADKKNRLTFNSQWIVILKSDKYAQALEDAGWQSLENQHPGYRAWTDNFSNLITAFIDSDKFFREAEQWRERSEKLRNEMKKILAQ